MKAIERLFRLYNCARVGVAILIQVIGSSQLPSFWQAPPLPNTVYVQTSGGEKDLNKPFFDTASGFLRLKYEMMPDMAKAKAEHLANGKPLQTVVSSTLS